MRLRHPGPIPLLVALALAVVIAATIVSRAVLPAWSAMLAAVLALGAATLWAHGRRAAAAAAARRAEHSAIAAHLAAAIAGDDPPPLRRGGELDAVVAAAEAATAALAASRRTLRVEERRSRFGHDLTEAFELADSDEAACRVAARAASLTFPGRGFQIHLADNSHAQLEPQLPQGAAACDASSPQGCPAVRRGRTLQQRPDGGIARCAAFSGDEATCAAFAVRGRTVGVVQLVGPADSADVETLTTLSFALGARLGIVRTLGERELAAATDPLTGLANRRAMADRIALLERRREPFAVLSADLDHFKSLNDTHGHELGDRCLRVFAQVLRDCARATDLPCRPGGEEFTVLLAAAGTDAAASLAERIHARLLSASAQLGVPFTVSIGLAAYPVHGGNAEEVLRCADEALYRAKDRGRNRTAVYGVADAPATPATPAFVPRRDADAA